MYPTILLKGITAILFVIWLSVFLTHSDLISYKREGPFWCYDINNFIVSYKKNKFLTQNLYSGLFLI